MGGSVAAAFKESTYSKKRSHVGKQRQL